MDFKRGLIRGVGLAIVAMALVPAIADAASRLTIKPSQPSPTSTIIVTFKVPKELPKGQVWMLGMTDGVSSPQSCATIDVWSFLTRGRKGQILTAGLWPQQDILDTNPTAWCTGQGASTWGMIAYSATRQGKPLRVVARRYFTIM